MTYTRAYWFVLEEKVLILIDTGEFAVAGWGAIFSLVRKAEFFMSQGSALVRRY
jgi:hypothetical protein